MTYMYCNDGTWRFFLSYSVVLSDTFLRFNLKIPPLGLICSLVQVSRIRCNLTYYEGENFSDSSFHHIFESENFRLPFFYKK